MILFVFGVLVLLVGFVCWWVWGWWFFGLCVAFGIVWLFVGLVVLLVLGVFDLTWLVLVWVVLGGWVCWCCLG